MYWPNSVKKQFCSHLVNMMVLNDTGLHGGDASVAINLYNIYTVPAKYWRGKILANICLPNVWW